MRHLRRGLGTACLCGLPPWATEKCTFTKPIFFHIMTSHNDQRSYLKHALDPLYVVFTLFGRLHSDGGLLSAFVTK